MEKEFRSFEDAREFVRSLGLKNRGEWRNYIRSGKKPESIPSHPDIVYKYKGWISSSDWIGKKFRVFEGAREFARSLGLRSVIEWNTYCKSGTRPKDIPSNPRDIYKNHGWQGMPDWLGIKIKTQNFSQKSHSRFRSFYAARAFVRSLGLKSWSEWQEYSKSGKKPKDIPTRPEQTYKGKGWNGMSDWHGNTNRSKFRSFWDAREFVRSLGLQSYREWEEYRKSGKRPKDIPTNPAESYKGNGWKGTQDWLGFQVRVWKPFKKAREFARSLGLRSVIEWEEYRKSGKRPKDIPSNPPHVYKEWNGWNDFLGERWRPFKEAREFVRSLGLRNSRDWNAYFKSEKRPDNIPSGPQRVYKEWKSWNDWLLKPNQHRSFEDAREFARTLGLKSLRYWKEYCNSGKKPYDIPKHPEVVYKGKGWNGVGDWLGTGTIAPQKRVYRSFEDAREFVRTLKIKNRKKWTKYCKSGKKPDDISSSPHVIYKGKGWNGWRDFLGGTGRRMNYEDAREFVKSLGLNGQKEWVEYCKSGKKPDYIPASPDRFYKGKGWKGMPNFLGYEGKISKYNIRSFNAAREFVKSLGLNGQKEWVEYCKSGKKPGDIPSHPAQFYKKQWKGMPNFLGFGGRISKYNIRSFNAAREFVRSLGLKNTGEWREYCTSGKKPDDIPTNPAESYKKQWKGMSNFLGIEWRSFSKARKFARSLELKSGREWREYCKSGKRPKDIPSGPDTSYKEWKSWDDFLDSGVTANQERDILPYNEAEKKAWRICKRLNINTPIEWNEAHRAGKIPKNLPANPPTYYQKKRGIAKNVENEYYTTWFKFSGTSSKWTEEVAWYKIKELSKSCQKNRFWFNPPLRCRGISVSYPFGIEEPLTYLYMVLNTDYVFKAKKHKVQFAEMLAELSLKKLELRGKSKMYIENEILFFYAHFYFIDRLRELPANHPTFVGDEYWVDMRGTR